MPNGFIVHISIFGWFIEFGVMQQIRLHHFIRRRLRPEHAPPRPLSIHERGYNSVFRTAAVEVRLSSVQVMNVLHAPRFSRSSLALRPRYMPSVLRIHVVEQTEIGVVPSFCAGHVASCVPA